MEPTILTLVEFLRFDPVISVCMALSHVPFNHASASNSQLSFYNQAILGPGRAKGEEEGEIMCTNRWVTHEHFVAVVFRVLYLLVMYIFGERQFSILLIKKGGLSTAKPLKYLKFVLLLSEKYNRTCRPAALCD